MRLEKISSITEEINVSYLSKNIHAVYYLDTDDVEMLEIWFKHNDVEYTTKFNAVWIPKASRKWLAEVLVRNLRDNVAKACYNERRQINVLYDKFDSRMRHGI